MVGSNSTPNLIEQYGEYIYIRRNVTTIPETEERDEYFEYDEMLLKGYSIEFVEENKDDIFANPSNYNVIQINGVYTGDKR
jgi:hypothetical protein